MPMSEHRMRVLKSFCVRIFVYGSTKQMRSATNAQVSTVIDVLVAHIDGEQAAINSSIPEPFRTNMTTREKRTAFAVAALLVASGADASEIDEVIAEIA